MYLRSGKTKKELKLNYLKYLMRSKSKDKDSCKHITLKNFILILEFIIDNEELLKYSGFKNHILLKIKSYQNKYGELDIYYQKINSIPIY